MNSSVLVDIKLNRPELPSRFIPRKRLEARLEKACIRDFILVSGPAGYGKSSAIAAWSRSAGSRSAGSGSGTESGSPGRSVLWFSLGPEDSSPIALATLFSCGLARLRSSDSSDSGQDSPGRLDPGAEGITEQAPRYLAALLARHLKERFPARNFVFILDDYHLCNSDAVNSFILELSNQSSSRITFIISSRTDPGLPISRLRAQNRIEEIRIPDLRFSAEELAAFMGVALDRPLPQDLLKLVETKTEGWPVGLQMMSLAMNRTADPALFIRDFSASHRFILDYLMEEVLGGMDEEWIRFLYRTSVAQPFSAGLCAELCGIRDIEDRLSQIEGMNLFLIRLDGEGHWYRYHHLFRDLLQMRAGRVLAEELPGLHLTASRWYLKNGFRELAFLQLLEGGFLEECFRFLEEESRELYIHGGILSLLELYEKLPLEAFQSHAEACIWFGWLLASVGKVRSVPVLAAWAEESVRREPDEGIRNRQNAGLASIRAMTANREGDYARAEAEAARAKSLFPEGASRDRAVASYIRATALILGNRFSEADEELESSRLLAIAGGDMYTQGMALSERARLKILGGKPEEALTLLSQAEVLATRGGTPALWCGMVHIYSALAYKATGDRDRALSCALRGLDPARRRGNARPLVLCFRLLFDIHLEAGEISGSGEQLAAMEGLLEEFTLYPDSIRIIEEARNLYAERLRPSSSAARSPGGIPAAHGNPLSKRETEILGLLAQGYTNQEMAESLFLSVGTVKTHLHNISEKIGTTNRTETAARARELGYLKN